MKKKSFTIFCSLLFFPLIISGQSGYPLTIRDAFEQARKNNPGLAIMKEKTKLFDAEGKLSIGLASPEVMFTKEGIGSTNNVPFLEKRFSVSQTISFPLKSWYNYHRWKNEGLSHSFSLTAYQLELRKNVKVNYAGVLFAEKLQTLRKDQVQLIRNLRNAVLTKIEAGESSELELIKIELKIAEAENDFEDTERILQEYRYELFNQMGLEPDEQVYTIRFPDSLKFTEIDINQENVLDRIKSQPSFNSVLLMKSAAEDQRKSAVAAYFPDISVSFFSQDLGFGYDHYGYEIGLSVPLWFMLNQQSEYTKADYNYFEAEMKEKETVLLMKKQIEHSWHSYETSLATIKRYESTIKTKSEELRQTSLEGYRLGHIDLPDLLDSQQTYVSSQIRYLTALFDYYLQLIELEKYLDEELILVTENTGGRDAE